MSGEVVAAPAGGGAALVGLVAVPIVLPLVAIGAAGAVAYGAGKAIKDLVDARVEAAVREMEAERARITEWQSFQAQQRQQQEAVHQQYEALRAVEQQLASIKLVVPVSASSGGGPSGPEYVSVAKTVVAPPVEAMRDMLRQIVAALDNAPAHFRTAPDSPFPRLKQVSERLEKRLTSASAPLPQEIISFQDTVKATINLFMENNRLSAERSDELTNRLDTLLSNIGTTRALTDDIEVHAGLQSLQNQTILLLEKDYIPPGQVEHLEQRVAEIKAGVETKLLNGAFRSTLASSLARNLQDMGYGVAQSFPDDPHQKMMQAEMRIPGGERLRVTIDHNNKMAFRVLHETGTSNTKLTAKDKELFRAQEKRWCADLKELIRRMTKEGFSYTIGHESLIPELHIPIAVVEDVEEIVSQQNEAEVELIRRRMQDEQANVRRMP